MKIKEGFILREVGGRTIVVATGNLSKSFRGMITLNDTAKLIWNELKNGKDEKEIVFSIMSEYECPDMSKVEEDVHSFIEKLIKGGILE